MCGRALGASGAGGRGGGGIGDVGRDRGRARDASAGGSTPGPPPQAAGPGGGRGAQPPKNLQVLKDVPPDQLQLTMQYIAASLGVQCNYCHVQGQNDQRARVSDEVFAKPAPKL